MQTGIIKVVEIPKGEIIKLQQSPAVTGYYLRQDFPKTIVIRKHYAKADLSRAKTKLLTIFHPHFT